MFEVNDIIKMVEIDEKQAFAIVSKAKETGKVKIGANEVTKALERGQVSLVITATDVSPAEIVAHFEGLCNEMSVPYLSGGSKAELGSLVGIKSTTALGVEDAGSAKKELDALVKEAQSENTKASSSKEEAPAKEESKEETPQESSE